MWKTYYCADTLDRAVRLLADHGPAARIVAGATDLILEIERGVRTGIEVLIDITRIPGLDGIRLDSDGWIHLGPLVTHNHCAASPLIIERAFPLARACWEVGAPQIRNRATVAGNLITASPANDSITPLVALGARVTLRSTRGVRTVPLASFYADVRRTVMQDGELLTDIAFRALGPGERGTFIKLGLRQAQAIALVNVAAVLRVQQGRVERAAVTLGAVAPTIIRAPEAEERLAGSELSGAAIAEAAELAAAASRPIDDLRASAEYRREMVRVCTQRALRALAAGRERQGYPPSPVLLWGRSGGRVENGLSETIRHQAGEPIETSINGRPHTFTAGLDKTLLHLLRDDAGLIGTKEGCAEGECGACTVFLDGMAVMSCLVPAPRAHGAHVVTIEGLASDDRLHPVQRTFIEEGAVQCGYCTPGLVMVGAKLLEERPRPGRREIEQAISGNLCRCTGYYKIIRAIEGAAELSSA
ncbi:MAG: FAD binding domain-containing protein [Chloroflexota bacterium]